VRGEFDDVLAGIGMRGRMTVTIASSISGLVRDAAEMSGVGRGVAQQRLAALRRNGVGDAHRLRAGKPDHAQGCPAHGVDNATIVSSVSWYMRGPVRRGGINLRGFRPDDDSAERAVAFGDGFDVGSFLSAMWMKRRSPSSWARSGGPCPFP